MRVVTGTLVNHKRAKRSQENKYFLIRIDGVGDPQKASRFIGRKAIIKTKDNKFTGIILRPIGNNGLVTAFFKRNPPEHLRGATVEIQ